MAWGYGARHSVPRLRNHSAAKAHYDSVKPIRGSDNLRPLGNRRNQHVQIIERANGDIGCVLYGTEVVRYYTDGRIGVNFDGWVTPTTIQIMNAVLSPSYYHDMGGIFQHDHKAVLATYAHGYEGVRYMHLQHDIENVFMRDYAHYGHDALVLLNPRPLTVHRLNRDAANNVRRDYKVFRKYVDRMMRLRGNHITRHEYEQVFGEANGHFGTGVRYGKLNIHMRSQAVPPENTAAYLLECARSSEAEDNNKALLMLWDAVPVRQRHPMYDRDYEVKTKHLLKVLDDLIIYTHKEQCLESEVSDDKLRKDSYKRFLD